jgi:hypothetical protein
MAEMLIAVLSNYGVKRKIFCRSLKKAKGFPDWNCRDAESWYHISMRPESQMGT